MVGVIDNAFVFEIQDGKDPKGATNWGRWGLFTHKDAGAAAKPRYNALRMLDGIGNQRLQLLGKGTWVKGLAARTDTGTTQVILANFDPHSSHFENVPITFTNIEPGSYTVKEKFLGGQQRCKNAATTAAQLQIHVAMPVNSVSNIELVKQ